MKESQTSAARQRWRWRLGLLIGAGLAALVYGFGIEPDLLRVESTSLDVPRIEHPVRVAVLTDLHVGAPHIDLDKLAQVVDETNAAQPDIVVVLGDLVIHGVKGGQFVPPEPIAEQLGRLRAQHVFAVLGNHDWWYDGPRVTRALENADVTVLENEAQRVELEAGAMWVAGVEDVWTREVDIPGSLAEVPPDEPVILLTHSPDIFPHVPEKVSITLAGHTHGGQVRVPFIGPPIVPSKYGARYAAGHVVEEGRNLFVSTGVGTSILPVRMFVVPRVDLLDLH